MAPTHCFHLFDEWFSFKLLCVSQPVRVRATPKTELLSLEIRQNNCGEVYQQNSDRLKLLLLDQRYSRIWMRS